MDTLRFSLTNLSFSAGSISTRKKTLDYDGSRLRMTFRVLCSKNKRGFGPNSTKKKMMVSGGCKCYPKIPTLKSSNASYALFGNSTGKIPKESTRNLKPDIPGLNTGFDDKLEMMVSEREFQEKLEVVRRSTLAQKKAKAEIYTQAIDYDTPIERDESTVGLGMKVGIGIAVVVFGTVFAFGDFLPSSRVNTNEDAQLIEKKLTDEEKSTLQSRLQGFQTTLAESPDDLSAVEGAAVTLVELGEYKKASDLVEKLTKERPEDPEAYRLLGEVKYQLKDYVSSAESYRKSLVSGTTTLEALRGVTNALLAAKKPEEAVQVLLSYAEDNASATRDDPSGSKGKQKYEQNVDPIQVRLLLGKAYSDWGHVSDAVAVYDQLIFEHPNDFRGYLAKGIILKENGKAGDAERMFIQARFFAPEKAKQLVDQYARK